MDSTKLSEVNSEAKALAREFRSRLMSRQSRYLKRSTSLSVTKVYTMAENPTLRRSKSLDTFIKTPDKKFELEMKHVELPKNINISVKANMDSKSLTQIMIKVQKYFKKDIKASKILRKSVSMNYIPAHKFIELVNIVLKQIDFNFEVLTMANYTQLLPELLRRLLYPRAVTSAMMKTVHTTQSWPLALQILSWLSDLRLIIEMTREKIKKNIYALPTDLPPKKLQELKIQQAEARTLVATYKKSKKGQSIKKELDVFVKDLRQIYSFRTAEALTLRNIIEKFFSDNKISQLAAEKQKEEMEEEETRIISLIQERKNLDTSMMIQKMNIKKLEQKIACVKLSNKLLRETHDKQLSNINKMQLTLSKNNRIQKERVEEEIESPVKSNVEEPEKEVESTNDLDDNLLYIQHMIREKVTKFNIELQKSGLLFKDFTQLLINEDMLKSEDFTMDIKKNIRKAKEIHEHFLHNLEVEKRFSQKFQEAIQQKLKAVHEIRKEQAEFKSVLKNELRKADHQVTQHLSEESKKVRQMTFILTKIAALKAKMPDLNELTAKFNEKSHYMQSLQKHHRDVVYNALEYFENLEKDVVHNMVPEYQLIRKRVLEDINMQRNPKFDPK